jgi:predicted transglutaminase-like cysteine proteinase
MISGATSTAVVVSAAAAAAPVVVTLAFGLGATSPTGFLRNCARKDERTLNEY